MLLNNHVGSKKYRVAQLPLLMTTTAHVNNTLIYPEPNYLADMFLGVVYILCSVIGLPANIAALCFFTQQRKQTQTNRQSCEVLRDHTLIFNTIYIFIICTDISILSTTFPIAEGFLNSRNPVIFSNSIFCTVWGIIWNILPFFSVFLVLTMSSIRTIILVKPRVKVRQVTVTCCILIYLLLLLIRGTVSVFLDSAHYRYTPSDQYCWEDRTSPQYELAQLSIAGTLLALPVLPIIFSCLVSVVLLSSRTSRRASTQSSNLQLHASVTVIIVTVVYILLNFPNFLNYCVYVDLRVRGGDMVDRYNSSFLWNYSWNLTYVMGVAVNSCVNPIVYLLRNRNYQREVERRYRDMFKRSRSGGSTCSGATKQTVTSDISASKL